MMSFHEMTDGDLAHYLRIGCAELFRRRALAADDDAKAPGSLAVGGDYEIHAKGDDARAGREPLSDEAKARKARIEKGGLPASSLAMAEAERADDNREQAERERGRLRQAAESDETAKDALHAETYDTGSRAHKETQREREDAAAAKGKGAK